MRHRADQLGAEVREAKLELERLEALREAPLSDLRRSKRSDMGRSKQAERASTT